MKQLVITDKNKKEYTLEFTRKTVKRLEQEGFDASLMLGNAFLSQVSLLFHGAFYSHHPYIKQKETDAILEDLTDVSDLVAELIEMYQEPYQTLLTDDADEKKLATWKKI